MAWSVPNQMMIHITCAGRPDGPAPRCRGVTGRGRISSESAAGPRGTGRKESHRARPASVAEWLPFLAGAAGAKPPHRVPTWLGLLAAGEVGVSMMTQIRGSSNAKAKRELRWQPEWPSWRQGFARGLT
jgi:hypothetical protein